MTGDALDVLVTGLALGLTLLVLYLGSPLALRWPRATVLLCLAVALGLTLLVLR